MSVIFSNWIISNGLILGSANTCCVLLYTSYDNIFQAGMPLSPIRYRSTLRDSEFALRRGGMFQISLIGSGRLITRHFWWKSASACRIFSGLNWMRCSARWCRIHRFLRTHRQQKAPRRRFFARRHLIIEWPFSGEKNKRAGLIFSSIRRFYFSLLKAGPLLLPRARETDAWLSKNRRAALLINHDVRFDETGARPWEMNNPSSQCADIMGCYKKYTSQGP